MVSAVFSATLLRRYYGLNLVFEDILVAIWYRSFRSHPVTIPDDARPRQISQLVFQDPVHQHNNLF